MFFMTGPRPCGCVERKKGPELSGHEATHTACEPSPQGDERPSCQSAEGKSELRGWESDEVMTKVFKLSFGPL